MRFLQLFQQKKDRLLKSCYGKYIPYVFGIVLFLAGAFFYFLAGSDLSVKVVLDTEEFNLRNGTYIEGLGYSISETDGSGEYIAFCGRNDIALHKGSYRVTINYMTNVDDNICYLTSPDNALDSVKGDLFRLRSDRTSISGIFRINDTKDNYIFGVSYCGNGTLTIQNILIEQTNDYLLNVCTAFVFLAFLIAVFGYAYKKSGGGKPESKKCAVWPAFDLSDFFAAAVCKLSV